MACQSMNQLQVILNCVNKFWTFQDLAGHGIPLPDTCSYGGHENSREDPAIKTLVTFIYTDKQKT